MKIYQPTSIRNIVLAGHSGSGKTTLAETMLFESGTTGRRGSIQNKNTVSDFHPIEKEKGKSVYTSLLHFDWRGTRVNLLDTPGTPDFIGGFIASLKVADSALFVIDAESGVETGTEALWKRAAESGLPSILVVNKLDAEQADFQRAVDMSRESLGREVVVVQYPYSEGEEFHAIIDVLKMTMYEFPEGGGRPDKLPIPESHRAQAELLQNELIESIAENDETLLDLYFEQGTLDEYQMREGLQRSILKRELFPLFCTSGLKNMGTGRIMGFIGNVLPSPEEALPVELTGRQGSSDVDEPVLFCFRSVSEPHVGSLNFVKVIHGKAVPGMELENRRDRSMQRIGSLFISQGGDRVEVPEAARGDLALILKWKDVQANDTLTLKGSSIEVVPAEWPEPVVRRALKPAGEGDDDKLGVALHQLAQEDPSLWVEHSHELKQILLHGQGEEHLSVVLEQLKGRFGLDVEYTTPRIPYRETITRSVRSSYKHKKQTGGAGQYAEVHMQLDPWTEATDPKRDDLFTVRDVQEIDLPWGGKLVFRNCIVGGVIDARFMPAVLKGVMEKMEDGPLCGCRARDVMVSVFDGSMHPVDSNEAAFRTASLMAFRDGFLNAAPQLLEPIYRIEVSVPAPYMGDVMSDLSARRGQILGMDSEGSIQKIRALVPLSELDPYATHLRSMTRGSAVYTRTFDYYAPVPPPIQEKVIREDFTEAEV